jgi:hypothetical protein
MASVKAAVQAKERVREILKGLPGIKGIGITWDDKGRPCVQVNIGYEIEDSSRERIPSQIEGIPVLIEVTGQIQTE